MMKEVESGKVGTILIKDMSRMGRDYLKVGQYMELLRQKNVRLIAVNENVDSFREDDDFTPFRNIMNEWYARDTSKKIVMYVPSRSGKKPLTILTGSRKNSRQMRSVPLWIHRSPAGRGMESTDFQRKDMADREAGSGKEQKKRVATNRIKMDLQS